MILKMLMSALSDISTLMYRYKNFMSEIEKKSLFCFV